MWIKNIGILKKNDVVVSCNFVHDHRRKTKIDFSNIILGIEMKFWKKEPDVIIRP